MENHLNFKKYSFISVYNKSDKFVIPTTLII